MFHVGVGTVCSQMSEDGGDVTRQRTLFRAASDPRCSLRPAYRLCSGATVKSRVVCSNWGQPHLRRGAHGNPKPPNRRSLLTTMAQDTAFGYSQGHNAQQKERETPQVQSGPLKSQGRSETCRELQVGLLGVWESCRATPASFSLTRAMSPGSRSERSVTASEARGKVHQPPGRGPQQGSGREGRPARTRARRTPGTALRTRGPALQLLVFTRGTRGPSETRNFLIKNWVLVLTRLNLRHRQTLRWMRRARPDASPSAS